MAVIARRIPRKIREGLLHESNGKCANPGCNNSRVEIHHIRQWSIYKAHDSEHMIAVCPTCHDACHNGTFKISDELLYRWKNVVKERPHAEANIFVPSAEVTRLSMGTVSLQQEKERDTVVFNLSSGNKLSFSVKNNWLKVSAKFVDDVGNTVLEVSENNLKVHRDKDVLLEQRPGRFRVTAPVNKFYLPATALLLMRRSEPQYASDGKVTMLDLEVIQEGQVRVQGVWPSGNSAIVVTEKAINVCNALALNRVNSMPLVVSGDGDDSVLVFTGPIDAAMFGIE
ncbi:HNH endonuclease [Pseudomonas sp. PB103]|uniref:HNH endonuclease signature motif containing protein n=1 Tax=Pseudomonas sp. PB103 TaxID=2494698 RepID=UPI00131C78E9|nr:HNH endonuclease signature motif containing protein [Pseudomonas sp. PB103]KAE9640687.1 HNH endonuclease [Pseudomonas sp. PB103]